MAQYRADNYEAINARRRARWAELHQQHKEEDANMESQALAWLKEKGFR